MSQIRRLPSTCHEYKNRHNGIWKLGDRSILNLENLEVENAIAKLLKMF